MQTTETDLTHLTLDQLMNFRRHLLALLRMVEIVLSARKLDKP